MVVVSGIISKRNTNQLSHCPNLVQTLSRPFSQVRTLPFFRIYKNPLPITCHSLLFFYKINKYIYSVHTFTPFGQNYQESGFIFKFQISPKTLV